MQVCNENPLPLLELLPIAPRTHKLNDPPQQEVTTSNGNIIKTLSYTRNNWIVFFLHICINFFYLFYSLSGTAPTKNEYGCIETYVY